MPLFSFASCLSLMFHVRCSFSSDATVRDLTPIFSLYGDVESITLYEPSPSQHHRCASIRYRSRDSAQLALELLDHAIVVGAEVELGWFDTKRQQNTTTEEPEIDVAMSDDAECGGILRTNFLRQLHSYKPHVTTQALAIAATQPTVSRAKYTLGAFSSRRDLTQKSTSMTDIDSSIATPADTLPPRELIPYEHFDY